MSKLSGLSIFFPCFNDEKSIGALVENAFKVAKNYSERFEILVIDDGSTDNSRIELKNLKKKYPELKLIFHDKNKGYGEALKNGFKNASKEFVFYTDGDGQYDILELPLLINLMTTDVDFVNGIKMARADPTYRIVVGNLYSFFARWLFWLPIYDVDCDYRLIRKKILDKIKLTGRSGSICVELVKKSHRAGATFRQVSVHHYGRKFGQSQFFRVNRLLSTFRELIRLWINLMLLKK